MLELIETKDFSGLGFYVVVRISITLLCWLFIVIACIVDFWMGIKAAKAVGQPLMSHGFRRTITKIGDYIRIMLFALMFDILGSLLPFYSIPFATALSTIAVLCIEGKSVIENSKRKKAHAGDVPEMVKKIIEASTTKKDYEALEEIAKLVHLNSKYEKNK